MIGNLLSCRFVGKRSWVECLVFTVVSYFITLVSISLDRVFWVDTVLSIALSFLFLKLVYGMRNSLAFNVVIVGFVVNLVLAGLCLLLGITLLL